MQLLYRFIFGVILVYLCKKYHIQNYSYEIINTENTLGSFKKERNFYYVRFNPREHKSIGVVIDTAFHEFAHILQYEIIPEDTLDAWTKFIGNSHGPKYFYSAIEVAARVFAKTYGRVDMIEVFDDYEPIQACSPAILVARGRRIARKYNVDH